MSNDNWTTPDKLYYWLDERFKFTVDAAATKANSKCTIYFSKKNSFLDPDLEKLAKFLKKKKAVIFCNPPYSQAKEFAERCEQLYNHYRIQSYLLLPVRSDRIWYQKLLSKWHVTAEPFTGRIHFGNAKTGAFMYNVGVLIGFMGRAAHKWVDAGQFNRGGKGGALS